MLYRQTSFGTVGGGDASTCAPWSNICGTSGGNTTPGGSGGIGIPPGVKVVPGGSTAPGGTKELTGEGGARGRGLGGRLGCGFGRCRRCGVDECEHRDGRDEDRLPRPPADHHS